MGNKKYMKTKILLIITVLFSINYAESNGKESDFQNMKLGVAGDYNYFRGGLNLYYENDFNKFYGLRTGFGFFDTEMIDVQVTKNNQKTLRELINYNLNLIITNRFYPFENDFSFIIGLKIVYPLYTPARNYKIKEARDDNGEKIKREDEPVDFGEDSGKVTNFRLDFIWGIEYETNFGLILALQHTLWLTNTFKDYHPYYPTQKLNQTQVGKFIPSFSIGCDWIRIANRVYEIDSKKITNRKFGVIHDHNWRPNLGLFYEHIVNNFCGVRFGAEYSHDSFFASFLNIKGQYTVVEFRNNLLNYGRRLTIDNEDAWNKTGKTSLDFSIHSLSIPITARFYPLQNDFCIFAGMQLDIVIKSYCTSSVEKEYEKIIDGKAHTFSKTEYENINVNKTLSNGNKFINRLRLSFLWGMDWETWFGLIYGFRHTIWLTKIVNADPDYLPYKKVSYAPNQGESNKIGITLGFNIATIINLFVKDSNPN